MNTEEIDAALTALRARIRLLDESIEAAAAEGRIPWELIVEKNDLRADMQRCIAEVCETGTRLDGTAFQ